MLRLLVALALVMNACAPRPPSAGPDPMTLSPEAAFAHYHALQPVRFRMKHEVRSKFGDREDVLTGFLVVEKPSKFFVRAMAGLGLTLFDVRAVGAAVDVDVRVPALSDPRAPLFLARDIRRIYLHDCPPGTAAGLSRGRTVVTCGLPLSEEPILADGGVDRPDDRLLLTLNAAALVESKCFSRGDEPTACVVFHDYRRYGDRWLAQRIELAHQQLPYHLEIRLVGVDFDFDTSRVFAAKPSGP